MIDLVFGTDNFFYSVGLYCQSPLPSSIDKEKSSSTRCAFLSRLHSADEIIRSYHNTWDLQSFEPISLYFCKNRSHTEENYLERSSRNHRNNFSHHFSRFLSFRHRPAQNQFFRKLPPTYSFLLTYPQSLSHAQFSAETRAKHI